MVTWVCAAQALEILITSEKSAKVDSRIVRIG